MAAGTVSPDTGAPAVSTAAIRYREVIAGSAAIEVATMPPRLWPASSTASPGSMPAWSIARATRALTSSGVRAMSCRSVRPSSGFGPLADHVSVPGIATTQLRDPSAWSRRSTATCAASSRCT